MGGVGGAVWSHGCCGRAGLLSVPVGGGPPASRPRRELRSARRLEARPGPAAAHGPAVRPCRPGGPVLKPPSPLRARAEPQLKPSSPLRVRNGCFLVQFSGAEVMSVSVVRRRGCAVVLLVSMSPWCRAWCAKKFARRRCVIAKVRKSSPSTLKLARNWCFCACWASFFTEEPLEGLCWASFFAPIGPVSVLDAMRCTFQGGCGGGFAPCEAL